MKKLMILAAAFVLNAATAWAESVLPYLTNGGIRYSAQCKIRGNKHIRRAENGGNGAKDLSAGGSVLFRRGEVRFGFRL